MIWEQMLKNVLKTETWHFFRMLLGMNVIPFKPPLLMVNLELAG